MRVLVLSGPNLDRLGKRQPEIYGTQTLGEVHAAVERLARERGCEVVCRQSNHEGDLVTWIGSAKDDGFSAIVINAGAYTHTSIALLDALAGAELPAVEVHLSHPEAREPFRTRSRIARACVGKVAGFGVESYLLGLQGILGYLGGPPPRPSARRRKGGTKGYR